MNSIVTTFVLIGILLFLGSLYNLLSIKKPGFYPPKKVLKERGVLLMASSVVSFILAIVLRLFQ